jgi:hypothetical protein
MVISVKQLTAPRRVLWRGREAPRVKLRCGRCGKHVITYVAPHLDHFGAVYVDLPTDGLIQRAGENLYTLQCSKKNCPAEYTLTGGSIVQLVSVAALLGDRTATLGAEIPSIRTIGFLVRFLAMSDFDRRAFSQRLAS